MRFEIPEIKIEKFEKENILTTSTVSGAAQELADELSQTASGGVNIFSWD